MMTNHEERETHQVDGRFVDAHIEGIVQQFKTEEFIDREGAFTNLEYFVRTYYPDLANYDIQDHASFYETDRTVMLWAQRFGHIDVHLIGDITDPYADKMSDDDIALGCEYSARLGNGTPVFAKTRKGAIVLAVVQAFRDMFHATKAGNGLRLVK